MDLQYFGLSCSKGSIWAVDNLDPYDNHGAFPTLLRWLLEGYAPVPIMRTAKKLCYLSSPSVRQKFSVAR